MTYWNTGTLEVVKAMNVDPEMIRRTAPQSRAARASPTTAKTPLLCPRAMSMAMSSLWKPPCGKSSKKPDCA